MISCIWLKLQLTIDFLTSIVENHARLSVFGSEMYLRLNLTSFQILAVDTYFSKLFCLMSLKFNANLIILSRLTVIAISDI